MYTYFSRLTAAGFPQLEVQKLTDDEVTALPDGVAVFKTKGELKQFLVTQDKPKKKKKKLKNNEPDRMEGVPSGE